MVAKIVSGRSIRGILHYNENKVQSGDAFLLMASGFAGEVDQMGFWHKLARFKHLTDLNARVKTNALHISLNFHVDDQPANEKMQQIGVEYMQGIGFAEQPFLVYVHRDSAHPHMHLITTNIRRDGSRIDLHDIGKNLSEPVRKALEIKYQLKKAQGEEKQLRAALAKLEYGRQPTKRAITNLVTRVSQEYAYASFAEFKAVLLDFGVYADRGEADSEMFRRNGLQYFAMDALGRPKGVPIKASSIYCRPTIAHLEKRYAKNAAAKKAVKDQTREVLEGILANRDICSVQTFALSLEAAGITLVPRRSERGGLYGLTYIDHRHKTVFNGSDLGKAYSAQSVEKLLNSNGFFHSLSRDYNHSYTAGGMADSFANELNGGAGRILETLTQREQAPNVLPAKRRKKRRRAADQNRELNL